MPSVTLTYTLLTVLTSSPWAPTINRVYPVEFSTLQQCHQVARTLAFTLGHYQCRVRWEL